MEKRDGLPTSGDQNILGVSEAKFRGFFTYATDAMFLTDEYGNIMEWNRAAEQLFNLPTSWFLGKQIADIQSLVMKPERSTLSPFLHAWAELQAAIRNGEKAWASRHIEGEICWPNGQIGYLEQTTFPIPFEGGFRLAGIYRDVTNEYLSKQAELRRHALLEKVIQLGKKVSRIINLQQCYREIYQCIQQGLGFDRVGLFTYDDSQQRVQGIIGTERTGEMGDKSDVVQHVQEGDTWKQILSSPKGIHFVDNTRTTPNEGDNMVGVKENVVVAAWAGEIPVGFIAVDNLLTERPITPEQIEALQFFAGYAGLAIQNARWNEEMEKRVIERTAALEEANRELESLSSTIAHDLRSPLRAVVGYSRILQDTGSDPEWDPLIMLQKIHTEGQRMGRMVDDFLAFLRLGRIPMSRKLVNMDALVQQIIEALQREYPTHAVIYSVQALPVCEADPSLMYLALVELLTNAIQFTARCANPRVEVGSMELEGETCYFVRDNGIGFNMDYAEKIYGIFERLHQPTDSDDEGTGIGLATVRRIVTRHGGRIWAESKDGQGATFYFTIQANRSATTQATISNA